MNQNFKSNIKKLMCNCIYFHPMMSINEFTNDQLSSNLAKTDSRELNLMDDFNVDTLRCR